MQSHHTQLSLESPLFNDLAAGRHGGLPEKISIPLPTASASPSDKWHLSFCHRQGAQTGDISDVWLTRTGNQLFFFFFGKKKKTLKELTRTLSGSCSKGLAKETNWKGEWKSFSLGGKKYETATRRNGYLGRSWHATSHELLWHRLFLCGVLAISQILTYSSDKRRKRLNPAPGDFHFSSGASGSSESRCVCQA